jgi:hypothetical protein
VITKLPCCSVSCEGCGMRVLTKTDGEGWAEVCAGGWAYATARVPERMAIAKGSFTLVSLFVNEVRIGACFNSAAESVAHHR